MSLTRDEILDARDRPVKKVPAPEWGGDVYVRTLSGLEMNQARGFHDGPNMLGSYAALALCDESGERLFTLDDAKALGEKDSNVLGRICDESDIFNGVTEEAREETKKK